MLTRNFNRLEIDEKNRIIRKSSSNVDKLKNEILFYLSAPYTLRSRMPAILGYAENYSWYEMEYLDALCLGDLVLEDAVASDDWLKVFNSTSEVLHSNGSNLEDIPSEFIRQVFIDKAVSRVPELPDGEIKDIFMNGCTINGRSIRPIVDLLNDSIPLIMSVPRTQIVLHGDMCFSNILYKPESGKVFFVDPRGGFDSPSIYGPAIYDIAKLSQSVYGLYDQIVGEKYKLNGNEKTYELSINRPESYVEIEKIFLESIESFNLELRVVKLLAGVMLAGTPALHLDDHDRALTLTLRAADLISESL